MTPGRRRFEISRPDIAKAKIRCPTNDHTAADQSGLPLPTETITTNAGKSLFSLPSPYDNHEPKLGRPAI